MEKYNGQLLHLIKNDRVEYTRNLIKWMNVQNQLLAKTTEVIKEYVKSYNSALVTMAEYHSNIIKKSNSSVSTVK